MWIIEDMEFMILVFIIVMILWLTYVSVIHAELVRVSFMRIKKGPLCKIYDTAKLLGFKMLSFITTF